MTYRQNWTQRSASGGKNADPIDDDGGASSSTLELNSNLFTPEALAGLDAFSHVEVIFVFDKLALGEVEKGASHPRGHQDWPLTGILVQRGKNRPNRHGVTVRTFLSSEGIALHLEGLDAICKTPMVDIKPVMGAFPPCEEVRQPEWVSGLMAAYW